MRHATRTVGALILAASSVYAAQASGVSASVPNDPANGASPAANPLGGLFNPAPGTPAPDAEPIPVDASGPRAQPLREGQPVKAGQVSVSETGTVEIHVVDANLLEVLRMLAAQSQKNIVASKEVRGAVTANLYDVTIKEALDAILTSNGFAFRERGNFVYVYTVKELEEIERASRRTQTEVFRLFYTPAANAVTMVKPVMSDKGQVSFTTPASTGLASGTGDVGGNSHATDDILVVNDYPENLDKVREILKEVDRRPQQILVEATILRASLTEDNALGVDFNMLAGVNFSQIITGGSNGQFTGAPLVNPTTPEAIARGAGQAGTGNNFTQGINNGLRMGFVSDNVSIFVAALEGITDTTVLANPKILALNKQKGEVIVGRKDGYLTTTVTSSSSTQTVEFLDTGTRLIFRPFIGDDGYIRMEIHPEDSSGGLTANANLPFKITTEVTSNVMVKDGRTIVIGGLFRESSDSSKNQVPLLGNIPFAGHLFKNQRDRTAREEIIILLTPHIIKDDAQYSDDSIAAQKDFEKLRVGVRQGMMITGRERLAEISYEKALAEMNKPEPDRAKALWHLDIATNLNPKFNEAVKLREKLTGQEVEAVDNSSVRGFVRRRITAEAGLPPSTRPASIRLAEPQVKGDRQDSVVPASTGPQASTATPVSPAVETAAPATRPASITSLPPQGDTTRQRRETPATPDNKPDALAGQLGGFWNSNPDPEPAAPESAPEPVAPVTCAPVAENTPATPPASPVSNPPSTRPAITVLEMPEK